MLKEAKVESKVPLFISPKLKLILQKINSEPIAKSILALVNTPVIDMSYIDIDNEDSKMVSYMPSDRMNRLETDGDFTKEIKDAWTSKLRQQTAWGTLINRILPKTFSATDIDRFYNRYRPEIDANEKEQKRFEVVHGEDIRYWYLGTRWESAFGSCMQGSNAQKFFDLYCNNPERVGLLIYYSEKNRNTIMGRGLVWNNLTKPSGDTLEDRNLYTLLDRVYYINSNPQIPATFHKYAMDNGWIYKSGEQFLMNGVRKTISVATRLKPVDYQYYPYVDTMYYYTPGTGRAASTAGNPAKPIPMYFCGKKCEDNKIYYKEGDCPVCGKQLNVEKPKVQEYSRYQLRRQDGGKTRI